VNNVVGHFSPYPEDETVLKAGDLAKMLVPLSRTYTTISRAT
jgi:methionine aminopeptidase